MINRIRSFISSLLSRKLFVALGTALAVLLSEKFGISEEATMKLVLLAAGYIFSQGLVDIKKEDNK